MNKVEQAATTQLANIEKRTGKSLAELVKIIDDSGLTKHLETVRMLKETLKLGHGDANALVHYSKKQKAAGDPSKPVTPPTIDEIVSEIYTGEKAKLRKIHDKLMGEIHKLGEFEIAPKKGYLSLRRSRQFAMIGPSNNTTIDVGLNMRGIAASMRLETMPERSMCQFRVRITKISEVDPELMGWIRRAYIVSK